MARMERELQRKAKKFAKRKGKSGGKLTRGGLMAKGKTGLSSYSDEDKTPASSQMRETGRAAPY